MYSVQINDNSTYYADLAYASDSNNSYKTLNGDDVVVTVNLTNPFLYNSVSYNILYINSNGTIGFNTFSNTNSYRPMYDSAASMASFFLPWADTNDPTNIYYNENVTSKVFTLIYNRVYYFSSIPYNVGIKLFLDGSGKAIINFGNNTNKDVFALLGFSFGSNNQANFITNNIIQNFYPPFSPLINIQNIQSSYTNKQIIITTTSPISPTITDFSIPTKTHGNVSFTITQPTSNSSGLFSYTSSNTSVATISGNIITIVGYGSSTITAVQESTTDYATGTITANFLVNQSTEINPATVNNSNDLLYFMNTLANHARLTHNIEIDYDLTATSYKILTGDNITISRV